MGPRGSDNTLQTQFAELSGKVEMFMQQNSKQHEEIAARLFDDSPNSIQGQINVINERSFGDTPTSLKSQIIEIQGKNKWATGYLAGTFAIFGALGTLLALKWSVIIEFFKAVSK